MTTRRTDISVLIVLFWAALGVLFWAVLAVCCGSVWASPVACEYPKSGVERNGSGIGGTGAVARGSGIGGTGARPDVREKPLRIAGNVAASSGTVEASLNGKVRLLANSDAVCVGETLATANTGAVKLQMLDGGVVELRSRSRIRIDAFDFDRRSKKSLIAMLEGTSRFVTGKIGKDYPQNVLVKTPDAVIGVHGTDHETTVVLPKAGNDEPAGTYDKVSFGVTFIRTERGEIDVYPQQVGFAAVDGEPPVLLHEVPEFLHAERMTQGGYDSGEQHANHATGGVEHHDHAENIPAVHEGHDVGAIPELPEFEGPHDLPEPPEVPDLPEKPEVPEVPEMHDE